MYTIPEDLKIGTVFDTNSFGKLVITSYQGYKSVGVKFLETGYERLASAGDIRRGEVADTTFKIKIGDVFSSKHYGDAEVVDIKTNKIITVRFRQTGYEVTTCGGNLVAGAFKDPYHPLVYSVGFVGVPLSGQAITEPRSYGVWSKMLSRCYNPKSEFFDVYGGAGVTVCEEWRNYQTFRKFFYDDKYRKDGWQIDKDIMVRNNLVYSPETCAFVPPEVNRAVIVISKNSCYPQGVDFHKKSGKFRARISIYGKSVEVYRGSCHIGAFNNYKVAKEAYLKDLAIKWSGQVDPRITKSLQEWKVFLDE